MSKRDRAAQERLSKRDYNYEHKDERGYYKKNHNSSKCIGVFGLDWDTTERELERRFKKFGEINGCVLIWNHKTNRSKGFGFVTYDDIEAAEMAVEEMNGTIIEGRKVRVDFSFTGTNAGVGARSRSRSPKKESRSRRSRSRSNSRSRSRRSKDKKADSPVKSDSPAKEKSPSKSRSRSPIQINSSEFMSFYFFFQNVLCFYELIFMLPKI